MIFTFLISYILAAQQNALICEQIFDPAYCTGPAAGAPGHMCVWDAQEYECKNVNMNEPEDVCKTLSHDQAACQAKMGCVFDLLDFECKGKSTTTNVLPTGSYPNSASTASHTNAYPAATGTGFNTIATSTTAATNPYGMGTGYNTPVTSKPAVNYGIGTSAATNNGVGSYPSTATNTGAYPATAANTGAYPGSATSTGAYPATATNAGAAYPATSTDTGAFSSMSTTKGALPNSANIFLPTHLPATTKFPSTTNRATVRPVIPGTSGLLTTRAAFPSPPLPVKGNYCKSLPQVQCFGASNRLGRMCFWDAEDFECVEAAANDIEAICGQYSRDPVQCSLHQDCFWDARDGECSEVKKMPFKNKPVLMAICGNFKTVDQCASQAMCFWDNTVCINVIQATNVCSVLEQPQPCSTNPLCHWQNNKCELANIPAPLAGGLRLQKTLDTPKATNTSSKTADYLIMFACGFTGALIGLLFALVTQKVCQKSQQGGEEYDFYRDIVLDVNSQRRHV